jgi:hypothetical protein
MNHQLEAANRQIAAAHTAEIVKALIAADDVRSESIEAEFNGLFDAIFAKLSGPKSDDTMPLTEG